MNMSLKRLYKEISSKKIMLYCVKQFVDKFGKFHKKNSEITKDYYESLPDKDKDNFLYYGDSEHVKKKKKDDDDDNRGYTFGTNPLDIGGSSFGGGSFGGGGAGSDW